MTKEKTRLRENKLGKGLWKKWGPYLSERQWGTVREDYSEHGDAWGYITHDMARSKAYRWGEDGIAGISDDKQKLCFGLGLWNKKDPIIKERLFGLGGPEGNHGEDVKEYYYYLDNTPSHSYMKMLYKYPQKRFPYEKLVNENKKRSKKQSEYELVDTGIFKHNEYFDVFVTYAKGEPEDIYINIEIFNRSEKKAKLSVIPQLWFRNTWSWGISEYRPYLTYQENSSILVSHHNLKSLKLFFEEGGEPLFCNNDTHNYKLYGGENLTNTFKDGINNFIVNGQKNAVETRQWGTKAGIHYDIEIPAKKSKSIKLRLTDQAPDEPFKELKTTLQLRKQEADEFYEAMDGGMEPRDQKNIFRQAMAGLLWNKQFYYYDVNQWLEGDPSFPDPPKKRKKGRNSGWNHLNNREIFSMPDKWEYPWFAAWDQAFHCIPLAKMDPEFAKNQLLYLIQDRYMHPNGQLPAYEWEFGDVNPPVHAWATWDVYQIDKAYNNGQGDTKFLERVYHKLLLNFTWWVNRKDTENKNIFQGGFLGLDNIGVFDRSAELPTGGHIEQADGTSWVAMYSLNLMRIALELSKSNPVYQDLASKFFEHFLYIAGAMANISEEGINLWDEEDQFFYDVLHTPENKHFQLKVRSIVGLIPLFAVEVLDHDIMEKFPEFHQRLTWFLNYRPDLAKLVSRWEEPGEGATHLLSMLRGHRMKKLLERMLDPNEFLSDYGIRALSKYHEENPYVYQSNGCKFTVDYQPGESDSYMFGGNSNWRGPVWFPINYLIIESLQKFYSYYGPEFKVEYPTGSGHYANLQEVASGLAGRLLNIFTKDRRGNRPVFGENEKFNKDPHFKDYLLFHEYFHGETGKGLGASHQTGWTSLVALLIKTATWQPSGKPSQVPLETLDMD